MKKEKNIIFGILIITLIQLLVAFEMNVVMPLAPEIAKIYDIRASNITYLNISFSLFGLIAPFIGYLSDKFGLKKMMSITISLYVLGAALIAFNKSIFAYIIGRGFIGICMSTIMAIGLNYLIHLLGENKTGTASGILRMAIGVAVICSPIIGPYLLKKSGFFSIYMVLFIIMLILLIAFIFLAPNFNNENRPITRYEIKNILKSNNAKKMIFITFLLSLIPIFFFNFLSVYLNELGSSLDYISKVYTIVASGTLFGGILVTFVSDKFNKLNIIKSMAFLLSIILLGFYFSHDKLFLVFGLLFGMVYEIMSAMLFPIGRNVVEKYKSTFLSLLSFVMSLSTLISNLIGPIIYAYGGYLLIIIVLILSTIISGIILSSIKMKYHFGI